MTKTCQTEAKTPSLNTTGMLSTGKKMKSPSKSLAKTLVLKPTIPEQNPADFEGISVVEVV
ncbi:hypothetical protein PanWU01x14_149080, partial [Parasponia andersonii]